MSKSPVKVAICTCAGDLVHTSFAHDLARLVGFTAAHARDIELRLIINKGTIIPQQRQALVKDAAAFGCTHVLFLDSDMTFPKDTLLRLLAHNEPIVGASYSTRRMPFRPVAILDGRTGEELHLEAGAQGLIEVAWTGLGCMLISLDVFREMPLPWFQIAYETDSHEYIGEDILFFHVARQMGRKVFVDAALSLELGHAGEWIYTLEQAAAVRKAGRETAAVAAG